MHSIGAGQPSSHALIGASKMPKHLTRVIYGCLWLANPELGATDTGVQSTFEKHSRDRRAEIFRSGERCIGCQAPLRIGSRAQLRGCPFPSVLVSMVFGGFLGVAGRMEPMSCSDFRMVRGLLMAAGFVMLGRLPMVFCCELVMFRRLLVVFSTLMSCHCSVRLFNRDFHFAFPASTSYSSSPSFCCGSFHLFIQPGFKSIPSFGLVLRSRKKMSFRSEVSCYDIVHLEKTLRVLRRLEALHPALSLVWIKQLRCRRAKCP
jgi:hypothetical protein